MPFTDGPKACAPAWNGSFLTNLVDDVVHRRQEPMVCCHMEWDHWRVTCEAAASEGARLSPSEVILLPGKVLSGTPADLFKRAVSQ